MSERARELFDGLKGIKEAVQAVAPGLRNVMSDIGDEVKRQATQGSMELASLLFNGNAFVLYGPGQWRADPQAEHSIGGVHGTEGIGHGLDGQAQHAQQEQGRGR